MGELVFCTALIASSHSNPDLLRALVHTARALAAWMQALAVTPAAGWLARHLGFPSEEARAPGVVVWTQRPGMLAVAIGAVDILDIEVPTKWTSQLRHWPASSCAARTGRILNIIKIHVDRRRTPARGAAPATTAAMAASRLEHFVANVTNGNAHDGAVPIDMHEQVAVLVNFGISVAEAPADAAERAA